MLYTLLGISVCDGNPGFCHPVDEPASSDGQAALERARFMRGIPPHSKSQSVICCKCQHVLFGFTSLSDSNVACWILKLYMNQSSETAKGRFLDRPHIKMWPSTHGTYSRLAPKCWEWISMFSGPSKIMMLFRALVVRPMAATQPGLSPHFLVDFPIHTLTFETCGGWRWDWILSGSMYGSKNDYDIP